MLRRGKDDTLKQSLAQLYMAIESATIDGVYVDEVNISENRSPQFLGASRVHSSWTNTVLTNTLVNGRICAIGTQRAVTLRVTDCVGDGGHQTKAQRVRRSSRDELILARLLARSQEVPASTLPGET
jgi:hypothetical protein